MIEYLANIAQIVTIKMSKNKYDRFVNLYTDKLTKTTISKPVSQHSTH